jgi:hypothetical protein
MPNLKNVGHEFVGGVQVHFGVVVRQVLGPTLTALNQVGPVAGCREGSFDKPAFNLEQNFIFYVNFTNILRAAFFSFCQKSKKKVQKSCS